MAKKKHKTIQKVLPVALTNEEQRKKGVELAKLVKRRIDIDEQKKQFRAEMRDKQLKVDEKIVDLHTVIRTGKEDRKVDCGVRMLYTQNKVEIVRTDTKEVVDTRAMKKEERQKELEFGDAKTKPPKGQTAGEAA